MIIFALKVILGLKLAEGVIVENKEKIYNLYNQEISDLMIGYPFNIARIKQIVDLIALDTCSQSYITELFE